MIDASIFGPIMSAYYGGRAEVRIRRKISEIVYTDFKSMYPTVNALMGLNRFLIAEGFTWRDGTEDVRAILEGVHLEELQKPETWRKLHAIVQIKPDGDILPVRTAYSPQSEKKHHLTIGLNHLTSDKPLWFTLADLLVSKLLSGEVPKIEKAIIFEPGPVQDYIRPINLLGREEYTLDPRKEDMFIQLINMRDEAKAKGDPIEKQLKILANSTCYGIFAEIVKNGVSKPRRLKIYRPEGAYFETKVSATEEAGRYFNPAMAALITGAARLMLACAERLALDECLDCAFCDTDSLAITHDGMFSREEFHERVDRVIAWFEGLNPYDRPGSILQKEDVNFDSETGEPKPLYCWPISAKRYALFNIDGSRRPIFRKASAHGLGHLMDPYSDDNGAKDVPDPIEPLAKIGVKRWQYDLWYFIVVAAIEDHPNEVQRGYHSALLKPAIQRYGASSPALLSWMKRFNKGKSYAEQTKPFGFLVAPLAKVLAPKSQEVILKPVRRGRPLKVKTPKPIAPFARDPQLAAINAFDRHGGRNIKLDELQTYEEALRLYHLSPEDKFINAGPFDLGMTERRRVLATHVRFIGKEANAFDVEGEIDPMKSEIGEFKHQPN